MKPPTASAASDMDQRRNMAARRRGLWAAAIVTTGPSPPSNPSDTFATKSDPFAETIRFEPMSWNNSPAIATGPAQPDLHPRQRPVDGLYRGGADDTTIAMTRAGSSARTPGGRGSR